MPYNMRTSFHKGEQGTNKDASYCEAPQSWALRAYLGLWDCRVAIRTKAKMPPKIRAQRAQQRALAAQIQQHNTQTHKYFFS